MGVSVSLGIVECVVACTKSFAVRKDQPSMMSK